MHAEGQYRVEYNAYGGGGQNKHLAHAILPLSHQPSLSDRGRPDKGSLHKTGHGPK